MRSLPVGITDTELTQCLAAHWSLSIDSLEYVPKGGGSYHWLAHGDDSRFVTVDDLDHKSWLGRDRETVFAGVTSAFEAAQQLAHGAALEFVVAPMRSVEGRSAVRLSDRYSVALFPVLDGDAGDFFHVPEGAERDEILQLLVRLHSATAHVAHPPRRSFELDRRPELEDALIHSDEPWTTGPLADKARELLVRSRDLIVGWLEAFDELTSRLERNGSPAVLTHGEPHPANFVRVDGRLLLIDWDTVALAPRERDLWFLSDGTADGFRDYEARTGQAVDPNGIELYALTWTLSDVADFLALLRAPHAGNADDEKALGALRTYLVERPGRT